MKALKIFHFLLKSCQSSRLFDPIFELENKIESIPLVKQILVFYQAVIWQSFCEHWCTL